MTSSNGSHGSNRRSARSTSREPNVGVRVDEQAKVQQGVVPDLTRPGVLPPPPYRTPLGVRLPERSKRAPVVQLPTAVSGLDIAQNSLSVLQRRYLAKDKEGKVTETPEQMLRRVAWNLAQGELVEDRDADIGPIAEEFYQLMAHLEFIPNSPTLMNAGRELQQLSACFVLPVPDDMEGIFRSATHTALIHKSGGGTGFAFSRLRPENDVVGSTGGIASGPVSFIRIFDTATEVVKQGGTRRGANMGILSVQHPDVLKFIHAKDDDRSLQNFNISVAVTEKFMQAVEKGEHYELTNPRSGKAAGTLNAAEVFAQLVNSAWKTGDPGIIFIDRMNEPTANPVPKRGPIEATNPCGEQPLYPYDSCNLGSINLAKMVDPAYPGSIDWEKLERTVFTSVRFLDNVVTMNRYPVAQIEETSKSIRRIGLGVMGWADMLLMLGIPYDSEEALAIAEQVMSFIKEKADEASEALADERGVFPDWHDSVYGPTGAIGSRPLRNSTRTTIAPTGTISIIANCSSGIEPLFALSYVRTVMEGTKLVEVNPYFEAVARAEGFYSPELMQELAERGTLHDMDVPEWVKRLFVTAHDIAPQWHVRMQAAFQKFTDNAVSKTVNFPHSATVDDVRTVYRLAYETGCRGVTIYRDGSKSQQVLSTGSTGKARAGEKDGAAPKVDVLDQAAEVLAGPEHRHPRERPTSVQGVTHKVRTGHGNMYVTINFDESQKPFEVFTALGKAGGCDSAQLEAISRLCSLALRAGVGVDDIIQQLRGITCCPAWDNGNLVRSAPDAVAFALSNHNLAGAAQGGAEVFGERTMTGPQLRLFNQEQKGAAKPATARKGSEVEASVTCPECSGRLSYQEGCLMCHSCGFNKCG